MIVLHMYCHTKVMYNIHNKLSGNDYYLAESVSVITPHLQRAALTLHSISTSRESTQLTITRASFTTLSPLRGWHCESDPLICSPSPQKSEMYTCIQIIHVCMYVCMHIHSPLLAVYPISASQTMRDMMVMTTDTVNIILYHNFMRAALEKTYFA